jgi:hypothetical protein
MTEISKFIGNSLEKVSENKLYKPTQGVGSVSTNIAVNNIRVDGSYLQRFLLLVVVIIVALILWHYIRKYFPEWKESFLQFYHKIVNKIYDFFHVQKPPPPTPPPKPKPKDLLTKAQMNNFHTTDKEYSEPQPVTTNETYVDETIFDKSNNLNSNEILDYLLKKDNVEEWCFVGESNGERHCTISEGNKCISGNVFPTKDLCINPKLR